jgi:hypothetical protein
VIHHTSAIVYNPRVGNSGSRNTPAFLVICYAKVR